MCNCFAFCTDQLQTAISVGIYATFLSEDSPPSSSNRRMLPSHSGTLFGDPREDTEINTTYPLPSNSFQSRDRESNEGGTEKYKEFRGSRVILNGGGGAVESETFLRVKQAPSKALKTGKDLT